MQSVRIEQARAVQLENSQGYLLGPDREDTTVLQFLLSKDIASAGRSSCGGKDTPELLRQTSWEGFAQGDQRLGLERTI